MEIKGKIIVIGDTYEVGENNFKKRDLVVETDEKYPQKIKVEFTQEKTELLDKFQLGNVVEVGINLRGNEWKGKYYVNINGWKINIDEETFSEDQGGNPGNEPEPINKEDENDLPF